MINSHIKSTIPTLGGGSNTFQRVSVGRPLSGLESGDIIDSADVKQEPAPISVMTSDKRIYSKKVMEGIDPSSAGPPAADFSQPPPGRTN